MADPLLIGTVGFISQNLDSEQRGTSMRNGNGVII